MPHRQTGGQASPPGGHPWLVPLISVLHPQRDDAIQHPIPLGLQDPSITLKPSSLDGGPPQEILVIEVEHGVVDVTHPFTIQTINDGGVLGVRGDNVSTRVRVPPLVGARNGHVMDAIGIMGDSRHDGRR